MAWIIGLLFAAIFWGLSAMPFIADASQAPMLQQLGLDLRVALIQMGSIALMYPVLKYFFITPLKAAMDERNKHLEETFSEAEELRERMDALRSDYEKRLAETEASAREQIQGQIREAQALRQQLMAEAAAKADELVKKAQEEIENEKNRVMTELRLAVIDLTLTATEKVLGENVDSAKNRKLVEDFIEKVEVPS